MDVVEAFLRAHGYIYESKPINAAIYNPLLFGSINAKCSPFILGKIYLSISRAALILLAFLSPSRMGSPLDFEGRKIWQKIFSLLWQISRPYACAKD
jgi:hypothetical protein